MTLVRRTSLEPCAHQDPAALACDLIGYNNSFFRYKPRREPFHKRLVPDEGNVASFDRDPRGNFPKAYDIIRYRVFIAISQLYTNREGQLVNEGMMSVGATE